MAKYDGAVVAEHNVEHLASERELLGVTLDKPHADRSKPCRTPGVDQLLFGQVKANGMGAPLEQRECPLRGATTEVQHVVSLDIAENLQFSFWNAPNTPRQRLPPEHRPV